MYGATMKNAILVICVIAFGITAQAQTDEPVTDKPQDTKAEIARELIVELPRNISIRIRPKITLQDALKKAEKYISKNKIDVSGYYLSSVTSFLYGAGDMKRIPVWQIFWMNERGAIGDYITILVSQEDGGVWQIPSM